MNRKKIRRDASLLIRREQYYNQKTRNQKIDKWLKRIMAIAISLELITIAVILIIKNWK